jgi:hypothetical protein
MELKNIAILGVCFIFSIIIFV